MNKLKSVALFMILLIISLPVVFATEINLQYDANGNIVYDGSTYREYNSLNQLVRIRNGSTSSDPILQDFMYHPSREQIYMKRTYNSTGQVAETVYYLSKSFVEVENSTGRYQFGYAYHEGQLVGQINPDGSRLYFHDDAEGSTSVVTNESGSVVENITYDPYGGILSGGSVSRFDSEGKEFDTLVGDYDFNFRKFCVKFGIFCQPDTLIPNIYNPQDLNRFSFENNNPYKNVDPTGHAYWGDLTFATADLFYNLETGLAGISSIVAGSGLGIATEGGSAPVSVPLIVEGSVVTTYAVGSATLSVKNIVHAINEEEPEGGLAEQVGGAIGGETGTTIGATIDTAVSLKGAVKSIGNVLNPKSIGTPISHSFSVTYNFVSAVKNIKSLLPLLDYKKKEEKRKEKSPPPSTPPSPPKLPAKKLTK